MKSKNKLEARERVFRILRISLKILLIGVVPATLLVGIWIYYPRAINYYTPGFGFRAECEKDPKLDLAGRFVDIDSYDIFLNFDLIKENNCSKIILEVPNRISFVRQVMPALDLDSGPFPNNIRTFLPATSIREDGIGQVIFELRNEEAKRKHLSIEIGFDNIVKEDFENFRLLIPMRKSNQEEPGADDGLKDIDVFLTSMVVSSNLEIIEASPNPDEILRQFGSKIVYFLKENPNEIYIKTKSLSRSFLKTIYNILLIGVAASIIATWIAGLIEKQFTRHDN